MTNSVYILGIEAKDIYNSNHLRDLDGNLKPENEQGYTATNKRNYLNALDFSINLLKLREVYESVRRNKQFSERVGHKEYSNVAVVVKFNYAYKEYNKASKNIYIKAGYLNRDVADKGWLKRGVFTSGGVVIGVHCNEKLDNYDNTVVLPEYFKYDETSCMITLVKEPDLIMTKAQLRQELYTNGFRCNGEYYVRDKRSSGSSRVGKCMFIYKDLYKRLQKWELCGLDIKDGDKVDLASLEAYISLPSSSCIDTMELKPENFLVIDDYISSFEDTVIGVEYDGSKLVSSDKVCKVENSIFDGQSIMDESVFGKYSQYSMLLLRNRFFKSACFKGKIQKWFADNNITDVSQLNGFTLAERVEDIKIITTPSSIKYMKFAPLTQWFQNIDPVFGIVKHEKPTHYLDGKLVQCHYQLINTLNLSKDDVRELVQPSLEYISMIRQDSDILKFHIKYPPTICEMPSPMKGRNEIIYRLLGINKDFAKTKMYYDFRNDLVKSMISNLKQGHLLIEGNYSTLLGNGIEMLQQAIGTFKGESVIGKGNIHSRRFSYGTILGSRSPHICSGNILLVKNVESELIDEYFDLSKEVVYVNAIGENIQYRLNGCDYDSDTLLLTNNKILISAAERNYNNFKVPTNFISAKKINRVYTSEDKCDLDVKTSVNKIGEIVNLSQMLNSIMWERVKGLIRNGYSETDAIKECGDIYGDICILGVMSNVEIDKAKKEFDVNSVKELKRLKNKWYIYEDSVLDNGEKIKMQVKPMFFKLITLNNGYQLNPRHKYRYFETAMDYLQKILSERSFRDGRGRKNEFIPFSDIVKSPAVYNPSARHYERKEMIIDRIIELKKELSKLYVDYDIKSKEEKNDIRFIAEDIRQECVDSLIDTTIPPQVIYLILRDIDGKLSKGYARLIFNTLFSMPTENFYNMIKTSEDIVEVAESPDGDIELFGHKYVKIFH